MIREARIENYLVRRVKKLGGQCRKIVWVAHRGAPDRLIGFDGTHAMVEMKRPKGPGAEAHQAREHEKLKRMGFRVYICHTREEVDEMLMEITDESKRQV